MSILSPDSTSIEIPPPEAAPHRRWRVPIALGALLVGGYAIYLALQSPGDTLRQDLARAGANVAALPWNTPVERVEQAVSRHFAGYRASVDTTDFPTAVRVTLKDLDAATCRDARRAAERIEGQVVIAIEGADDGDCRDGSRITWRIMP